MSIMIVTPCLPARPRRFLRSQRKTDPILAVTLGKLKVEGSIDKALKLKDLLKKTKK